MLDQINLFLSTKTKAFFISLLLSLANLKIQQPNPPNSTLAAETRRMKMTTLTSTLNLPALSIPFKKHSTSSTFSISALQIPSQRRTTAISCNVALKQDSPTTTASTSSSQESEEPSLARIGAKVKVKVPLKVYHAPKIPELDLFNVEGTIKQYVGLWKGKRISANLPFKVEFFVKSEGRNEPVKFFAHLKEDEFDYLD